MKLIKRLTITTFCLICFYGICLSQKQNKHPVLTTNKWINACINLEARSNFFASKRWVQLLRARQNGENLPTQVFKKAQDSVEGISYSATAIFLFYNNKHYLITARHFLLDPNAEIKGTLHKRLFLRENGSSAYQIKSSFVDTLPEVHYLEGFINGPKNMVILSKEDPDVAIISLDDIEVFGRQFIAKLYTDGYRPIKINDISPAVSFVPGSKISVYGFPRELSEITEMRKNRDSSYYYWQSRFVTLPVLSKGVVKSDTHADSCFYGDIYIQGGSSGGPVVSNNKLIGMTIENTTLLKRTNSHSLNLFYEQASTFVKSRYILLLLKKLERRFSTLKKPNEIDWEYGKHFSGFGAGGQVRFAN